MATAELKSSLSRSCPDVPAEALDEFLERMDPGYFLGFPLEEVAAHLRLVASLDAAHPVRVEIRRRRGRRMELVVAAFDYFGELSILCGVMASFGLDIQAGAVHTYSPSAAAPAPALRARALRRPVRPASGRDTRRKIVDVFRVRVGAGYRFGPPERDRLETEIRELQQQVAQGGIEQARERLNRRVIERVGRLQRRRSARPIETVEVRFRSHRSRGFTVIDVRGRDTPAFLYALTNAFSLRGIYIHRVRIRSVGGEARDRFEVSDRQGRALDDPAEREALRRAVVLIKQFTHFLPEAPDPARALRHFDLLLDKLRAADTAGSARIVREESGLVLLAHLLGSSDFLWEEFLRHDLERLLPVLEQRERRALLPGRAALATRLGARVGAASDDQERRRALNDFKNEEMFFILLEQLEDPAADIRPFSAALSDLAEVVISEAVRLADARLAAERERPRGPGGDACPFAALGLGKLGGRELGYASDLELVFLYDAAGCSTQGGSDAVDRYFESLVREVTELVEAREEGAFHIDLRLRPHGKAGPLAVPIRAWQEYFSDTGAAAPFERQALIKARGVAGNGELLRRALEHRDRFVYGGAPWDMAAAMHLRERQARELVGSGRVNVKYSRGGLIDVEYAAQYLQILHGHEHAALRTPSTWEALDALHAAGLLDRREHALLLRAYVFLRRLTDALRMVRGNARDLELPDEGSEDFAFLARRMGYRGRDWAQASQRLADEIHARMTQVRDLFQRRFVQAAGPPGRGAIEASS